MRSSQLYPPGGEGVLSAGLGGLRWHCICFQGDSPGTSWAVSCSCLFLGDQVDHVDHVFHGQGGHRWGLWVRRALLKLSVSGLPVVDTFSLSIFLVADAVYSGPPSEAISMLMPKVVKCVLRAEISPWAPSFFPTSYTDSLAEYLSMMRRNFLAYRVRLSEYTNSNGYDGCDRGMGGAACSGICCGRCGLCGRCSSCPS